MGAFTPFPQVPNPTHRPSRLPHASIPLPFPTCKAPFSQCLCLDLLFLEFSDSSLSINPLHIPAPRPHTSTHPTTLKNPLISNYTSSPQGSPSSRQAKPDHPGPCPQMASLLSSTCHNGYYFIVSLAICVISPLSCKP